MTENRVGWPQGAGIPANERTGSPEGAVIPSQWSPLARPPQPPMSPPGPSGWAPPPPAGMGTPARYADELRSVSSWTEKAERTVDGSKPGLSTRCSRSG